MTIKFIKTLPLDRLQITMITPFPGSRLFEQLYKEGKLLTTDWDEFGPYENKVYFEYDNVKADDILRMYKKAYRAFYLRPSYIAKTLRNPVTYSNLPLIVKNALRFMK